MHSPAATRNWRVEALAWAGAIALVAAAIFFSRGGDQPAEATSPQEMPPQEIPRQEMPRQDAPTSAPSAPVQP